MALSNREQEFNKIVGRMEDSEKKGLSLQVLQLCDELIDNFKDLLDKDKILFLKGVRGRALTKIGQFEEAMNILEELLEYNIKNRLPVASSTHMYRWLCAYYKGDEEKALDEHIKLTDNEKAINFLRQAHIHVNEMPPVKEPINIHDNEAASKLIEAAKDGLYDGMIKLAEEGAPINAIDEKGNTALFFAAASGNLEIVKYLVEKGADVNIRHSSGNLALDKAALEGYIDIVKYLADHGSIIQEDPLSPLILAIQGGHFNIVKYLVDEKQLDINKNYAGLGTSLHFAAGGGFLDIVRFLVEKGANTSARTKFGDETPVEMAKSRLKLIDDFKNIPAKERATYKKNVESVIRFLSREEDVKDIEVPKFKDSERHHNGENNKLLKPRQWWKFWQ